MTAHDPDELRDVIDRMRTPKHAYDRDSERYAAAEFVAEFGSLGQLFAGEDLIRVRQWTGHPSAAWGMLGHWSAERGDPDPDPDAPFDHASVCDVCAFLEDVAVLREVFESGCPQCGLQLAQHDIEEEEHTGEAIAVCRPVWTRVKPDVDTAGDVDERQTSEQAYNARWKARAASGEWAVVTRAFYLGKEYNADTGKYDGPEFMYRQDEFTVCTDPDHPGDTELNADYRYMRYEAPPSMDPQQMARDATPPTFTEWERGAPSPYGNLDLPILMATV